MIKGYRKFTTLRILNNDVELKINDSPLKEISKRYKDETYHSLVNQRDM